MALAKRIFLFLTVTFLVMVTLGLIFTVLGVSTYMGERELDFSRLMIFCFIWSVAGACIVTLLSKNIAKGTMGVQIINPKTIDPRLARIVQTVYRYAEKSGLQAMPEVGVYTSAEVNAFATGSSRNKALVAISTGLFQRLTPEEVDGVIGHEVAHIANGDMVTMTLIQGVVNAFVMFFACALTFAFSRIVRGKNGRRDIGLGRPYLMVHALESVLMFFGMIVVAWFSRHREFRADTDGADIASRTKMLSALHGLRRTHGIIDQRTQNPPLQTSKISTHGSKFFRLFSSHPTLEARILRLQAGTKNY